MELGDNKLLQFDFSLVYQPGSENAEAGCLSQKPALAPDPVGDAEPILPVVNLLSLEEIRQSHCNVQKTQFDTVKNNIILRSFRNRK